jgi:hypothetical protein
MVVIMPPLQGTSSAGQAARKRYSIRRIETVEEPYARQERYARDDAHYIREAGSPPVQGAIIDFVGMVRLGGRARWR